MPRFVYQVCFPDSSTVVRSFPSLVRARSFLRTMSADARVDADFTDRWGFDFISITAFFEAGRIPGPAKKRET